MLDAGDLSPFPQFFTMGEAVGHYLAAVGILTKMRRACSKHEREG